MAAKGKKLKAFVDRENKSKAMSKGKHSDEHEPEKGEHDEHEEHDEEDEHDDKHKGGEGGGEHGDDEEEHDDFSEDDLDEIADAIKRGKGDKKLVALSKDIDEDGDPDWVEDEALWEKAKEVVEPHWEKYDQPYAVVAHVYKLMGGETK